MHADGKSTLASVSEWNSGKVNYNTITSEVASSFLRIIAIGSVYFGKGT